MVISHWSLVICFALLPARLNDKGLFKWKAFSQSFGRGHWLDIGYWILDIGYWLFISIPHSLLFIDYSLFQI